MSKQLFSASKRLALATAASLAGYRAAGANRLSFGAQSFRADELARLGRLHGHGLAHAIRIERRRGDPREHPNGTTLRGAIVSDGT